MTSPSQPDIDHLFRSPKKKTGLHHYSPRKLSQVTVNKVDGGGWAGRLGCGAGADRAARQRTVAIVIGVLMVIDSDSFSSFF